MRGKGYDRAVSYQALREGHMGIVAVDEVAAESVYDHEDDALEGRWGLRSSGMVGESGQAGENGLVRKEAGCEEKNCDEEEGIGCGQGEESGSSVGSHG